MVFIDETWAKTNMTRTRGWCTKGQPLIGKVPHGHWKTLTFIAGLRHDGIVAPCVLDGPINGETFTAWVEQFLIPELEPGSIVVLDNLGSHKGSRVRKLLRAAGIKLFFLPPYSPDRNPIEEVFSKFKRLLRKANERTVEATWRPHRQTTRPLPSQRMRQLHQGCRICLNLSQKDSSCSLALFP